MDKIIVEIKKVDEIRIKRKPEILREYKIFDLLRIKIIMNEIIIDIEIAEKIIFRLCSKKGFLMNRIIIVNKILIAEKIIIFLASVPISLSILSVSIDSIVKKISNKNSKKFNIIFSLKI